jgi:hypothetical protein
MTLIAALILTTTLGLPADVDTLVLRSGEHIALDGPIREDNGRIVFRAAGGALYSIRSIDVDVKKTRYIASKPAGPAQADPAQQQPPDERLKLRVSDAERQRLLRDLERNHSGQPAQESIILSRPPELPTRDDVQTQTNDEWAWRLRARSFEESVRQAKENLALLERRIAELRSRIAGFVSLGYRPVQFSYDTAVLQTSEEQIPYAELEVARAERQWEQFREDARRQGVMPGWLR